MATYKILSLDGGGIRGLLVAVLLKRLKEMTPGWLDAVDLIAGTSTGGIIALGLAHGLDPEDLRDIYYHKGSKIFDDSWLDNLLDLGQISGAEYDNRGLRQEMRKIWGKSLLKDLEKRVLISSFDLDNKHPNPVERNWKPKFFHNFDGDDSDGDLETYKVALYTSAAPTFFPSVDGFIDGGVIANSPGMAALAQVLDSRAQIPDRPTIDQIVLLSVGTGHYPYFIKGERLDWGYAQWAKPIIKLMMNGSMGVVNYQCKQILGERYYRISPTVMPAIDLDDWRKRDDLEIVAHSTDLSGVAAWLKKFWI